MSERTQRRRHVRPETSGRFRAALISAAQAGAAVVACTLWVALALPGLHLLPGLGNGGDASVAISLQSALLGIDDRGAQPVDATLRASLRTLGIDARGSLRATLSHSQSTAAYAPLIAEVDPRAGGVTEVVAQTTPPAPPDPAQLAVSSTQPTKPPHLVAISKAHSRATTSPLATLPALQPPAPKPPVSKPPAAPPPVALPGQTIVFTSVPPASAIAGGAAYVVAATASSGLAVVFKADASSAGVCTVVGAKVTPVGNGTCTIDAEQPGDATHLAAPRVQQSFAVGSRSPASALRSVQSISFTSSPPPGPVVGAAPYVLAATASSGLPVTYSTSPGSDAACTLAGNVVSFVGSGTCRVFADQSGDDVYLAAPQVQQLLTVSRVAQAITFTSIPAGSATVGDPAYVVAATASSGLPVVFAASSSSAGVCTVSGSSIVAVGAGTCVIDANQFGDSTYASVLAQQSFVVGGGAPSLSVQSIQLARRRPQAPSAGGAAYTVGRDGELGSDGRALRGPASAGVCTVSGRRSHSSARHLHDRRGPGRQRKLPAAPQAQQSFPVSLVARQSASGRLRRPARSSVTPPTSVAARRAPGSRWSSRRTLRAQASALSPARRCRSSVRARASSTPISRQRQLSGRARAQQTFVDRRPVV